MKHGLNCSAILLIIDLFFFSFSHLFFSLTIFLFFFLLVAFLPQVTAVGINTEWGLLMASISEDNGEETPLQVPFLHAVCF